MKKIIICDDSQSLSTLVSSPVALGYLQPTTGTVTEELNGSYEAEFTVSTEERRFSELHVGGIVRLTVNDVGDEQLFRVYEISVPINSIATVKACHITYDLSKVAVKPFSSTGAQNTVTALMNNALNLGEFTMSTNYTNTTSAFTNDIPRYFRECLGGWQGSVLDVFQCEYEWDNLEVKMLTRRGADNGVRIAYGKNITDFRQEQNNESVYTAVLGYAVVDETTYTGNIYHKITSATPKIKIVDFTADYESGQTPTVAELTTKAQTYATNNDIEVPKVNINVSFIPLSKTLEYKNIAPLEEVGIGDTVHIDISKLGVTASSRVIRTVFDLVKGRYESLELGSAKANLTNVIDDTVTSAIETYDHSFEGVTGVKGNAETDYRTGNVNLTPQNLGITVQTDFYTLPSNSSVTFNMSSGQFMSVIFAKRYQASTRTGGIFLLEQYHANVEVIGTQGNITVTRDSSRLYTVANTGTGNIPLIAIGGYFS